MVIELILTAIATVGKMSSTTRYLKTANKSRKAISPVIATVILVAVAVVIAAAMAGFASSLFGTYSQNSQIVARDVTITAAAKTVVINFVNKGAAPETITAMNFPGVGAIAPAAITGGTLSANAVTTTTGTWTTAFPASGTQVTVTATTSGGQQYTISGVVQ